MNLEINELYVVKVTYPPYTENGILRCIFTKGDIVSITEILKIVSHKHLGEVIDVCYFNITQNKFSRVKVNKSELATHFKKP